MPRRSRALEASEQYWRWLGRTLAEWASGRRRRHRRLWVILGGPVTMLVWLLVLATAWMLLAAMVTAVVLTLAALGLVLTLIGGVDQARLALTRP